MKEIMSGETDGKRNRIKEIMNLEAEGNINNIKNITITETGEEA